MTTKFLQPPKSPNIKPLNLRSEQKKDERSRSQSPDRRRLNRKKKIQMPTEWTKIRLKDTDGFCDDYLKCVIIGDKSVGKSALAYRYTRESFPIRYVSTVCDNFRVKLRKGKDSLEFDIWDTGSDTDCQKLRLMAYPNTNVVLICFSLLDRQSFENVERVWIPEIKQQLPGVPYGIVGTKLDVAHHSPEAQPSVKFMEEPQYCQAIPPISLKAPRGILPPLEPKDLPHLEQKKAKKKKGKMSSESQKLKLKMRAKKLRSKKNKSRKFSSSRAKTLPSPLKFRRRHRHETYGTSPKPGMAVPEANMVSLSLDAEDGLTRSRKLEKQKSGKTRTRSRRTVSEADATLLGDDLNPIVVSNYAAAFSSPSSSSAGSERGSSVGSNEHMDNATDHHQNHLHYRISPTSGGSSEKSNSPMSQTSPIINQAPPQQALPKLEHSMSGPPNLEFPPHTAVGRGGDTLIHRRGKSQPPELALGPQAQLDDSSVIPRPPSSTPADMSRVNRQKNLRHRRQAIFGVGSRNVLSPRTAPGPINMRKLKELGYDQEEAKEENTSPSSFNQKDSSPSNSSENGGEKSAKKSGEKYVRKKKEKKVRQVLESEGYALSKRVHGIGYWECSALKAINVDPVFKDSIELVVGLWLKSNKGKKGRKEGCTIQ